MLMRTPPSQRDDAKGRKGYRESTERILKLARERHDDAPVILRFDDGSSLRFNPTKAWDGNCMGVAENTRPGMTYSAKRSA